MKNPKLLVALIHQTSMPKIEEHYPLVHNLQLKTSQRPQFSFANWTSLQIQIYQKVGFPMKIILLATLYGESIYEFVLSRYFV